MEELINEIEEAIENSHACIGQIHTSRKEITDILIEMGTEINKLYLEVSEARILIDALKSRMTEE